MENQKTKFKRIKSWNVEYWSQIYFIYINGECIAEYGAQNEFDMNVFLNILERAGFDILDFIENDDWVDEFLTINGNDDVYEF